MESMVSHNKIGQAIMHIICILLCVACIAPFVLLITSSLTEEATLVRNGYSFLPETWSLESYLYIARKGATIFRAYGITVLVTFIGQSSDDHHVRVPALEKRAAGPLSVILLRVLHDAF